MQEAANQREEGQAGEDGIQGARKALPLENL